MRRYASYVRAPLAAVVSFVAFQAVSLAAEAVPAEREEETLLAELMMARTGAAALLVAPSLEEADLALAVHLRRNLGLELHICFPRGNFREGRGAGPGEEGAEYAREEAAARLVGARIWRLDIPSPPEECPGEDARARLWREKAAGELVRAIRRVAPAIIVVCRASGRGDGAGDAPASAAIEAFDAATDPAKFPTPGGREGFRAWEVSKLYVRTFDPSPADLQIETNRPGPGQGLGPARIAQEARRLLTGKDAGAPAASGISSLAWYRRLKSRVEKTDSSEMTDGLERIPDEGFPGSPPAGEGKYPPGSVMAAIAAIGAPGRDRVEAILAALVNTRDLHERLSVAAVPPVMRAALDRRLAHLGEAARIALGLRLHVRCDPPLIAPGGAARVEIRFHNGGSLPVAIKGISLPHAPDLKVAPVELPPGPLEPGGSFAAAVDVRADGNATPAKGDGVLRVALTIAVEHEKYRARLGMSAPAGLEIGRDNR
ncbi:MAG: small integral membrane protein 12 [Planctomycetota bacterium]|nr:small integral membrane protein 12 [Planctomycetota bacterium]